MTRSTKILFGLSLGLLILSFPTCRLGEHAARNEMARFPAEFVAAHEFDFIFIKWVLPGIAMLFLGGILALIGIVSWVVGRKNAHPKPQSMKDERDAS